MKHAELSAFLHDLTRLIQGKYHDTLSLIHSQLLAFGIPTQELEPVVPELGQPALGKA